MGLYPAPFAFGSKLIKVTETMDEPEGLDGEAVGQAELARQ